MSDSDEEELFTSRSTSAQNWTPRKVILLTGLAAIGGFLFGYDTGVVSGAFILVRRDMSLSDTWQEVLVSGTLVSAFLTALTTGTIADKFGRRPTILLGSFNFAIGSLVMAVASGKEILLVGRLLVGVGVGLASTTVPLYIGETSTPSLRGALVTLNTLAIVFGQLVASVLCGVLVDIEEGWRYMLGLALVPAVIQLIGFFFMPESPRFLVRQGKYTEAQEVLISIRNPYHQIQEEFEDIKVDCSRESGSLSMLGFLKSLPVDSIARKALFLGCLLQFCQQLAGINTVMYYAASIIKMAGASNQMAVWFSAVTAAINFLFTILGLKLVHIMTRRRLLFVSMCCVIVSLLIISTSFLYMGDIKMPNQTLGLSIANESLANDFIEEASTDDTSVTGPVLILVSLSLYLISFAPGLGPLPWTINSEIHPGYCRAQAQSLSTSSNWLGNLLVSFTFLR
ncbi:proton myo-inositol cotransporter [Eurytemora carolleeae]|uniref:proton myo-inositol cotransporter n=1 Tax=Eurytemora carolleeae TaxID=1294199 RepID=UPI000C78F1B5|nr:proton myo-inositol cotransporter [Eurytemora carolleeae]|eukprot:XP_023344541.1 proton myo-inositol cotransporter-like [Eurytemora affinis]